MSTPNDLDDDVDCEIIRPDLLLGAYASGIFPMSEHASDDEVFWVDPEWRGILPLDKYYLPKRLRKTIRQQPFEIRINAAFKETMLACQETSQGRSETWISELILNSYCALNDAGHAHSVECWDGDALVGGLYGVSLEGAFFGESMFSRKTDASKIALAYLVGRLKRGGFTLLDCQFRTEHLSQFGVIEVPRGVYHTQLSEALEIEGDFHSLAVNISPLEVLQIIGQTSKTGCSSA